MSDKEAVRQERLERLLELAGIESGTLWKVREDIWMDAFDYESGRKHHPGLCLRERKTANFYEPIPMLQGGSKQRNFDDIAVKGFGAGKSEHSMTYFGGQVAPVPVQQFVKPAEDWDRDQVEGNWWESSQVVANPDKHRLDEAEMSQAVTWAKRRFGA